MKLRNTIIFLLMSVLFLFTVVPAQALTLGFSNITHNIDGDAAIGEAQLFVDVTDPLGGQDLMATQVLFTFGNTGPETSSICDVYFDDGSLLGIASIDNSWSGVSFSQNAKPEKLPGRNNVNPNFKVTAGFSADSNPPVQPNGVNPGEYLGILFDLQTDLFFNDVLNDLDSDDLRIGIYVQGFATGGIESFINNKDGFLVPQATTPEPATMLLLGSGLIGIAVSGKKRLKKRNG